MLHTIVLQQHYVAEQTNNRTIFIYSPILANVVQLTPAKPRAAIEKPTVAPTMEWVPEMGSLKNVATMFHTELPAEQMKMH